MNRPELIIFDLGRVLVDFDFRLVIRRLARYTSLSEKEIRAYFHRTPLWDTFECGDVEPHAFFRQVSKELKLKKLNFEEFAPLWNSIFSEKPDSVSILSRLKGRYRLALLSNVNIMHWDHVWENHDFLKWIDYPIASWKVGCRKPDPEIYRSVLHTAGVAPQKAVFIDDYESHVLAARSLGMRAYQFTSARQLVRDLNGII